MVRFNARYSSFTADSSEFIQATKPFVVCYEDNTRTEHHSLVAARRHAREKDGRVYEWDPFRGQECWHPVD